MPGFTLPPFFPITTPPKIPSPYGKKGSRSLAARLASRIPENKFQINENECYGEIWMSDHPANPSLAILPGNRITPLHQIIRSDPTCTLGPDVYNKFHRESDPSSREEPHLPFIFKILSFDKPLPLQVHPDRFLASKLHEQELSPKGHPEEFSDKNYKPEVAICIDNECFESFIGFRPISEIQQFLKTVHELQAIITEGNSVSDLETETLIQQFLNLPPDPSTDQDPHTQQLLKKLVSKIILQDDHTIAKYSQKLLKRLEQSGAHTVLGPQGPNKQLGLVLQSLLTDYPNDKATFIATFLMNYLTLQFGEGAIVGTNELHAYLKGNIVGCMAWGDNMLSYGFQPPSERSNPHTFLRALSFAPPCASEVLLRHTHSSSRRIHYYVPNQEFNLLRIILQDTGAEELLPAGRIKGPSILIVVRGRVELMHGDGMQGGYDYVMETGRAMYVLPGEGWRMKALENDEEGHHGAEVWGAYCNV